MAPKFADPLPVPGSDGPVLELIGMYAASAEARMGGQLMKELSAAAPLSGLPHVKRIRKLADSTPPVLQVLLCPAEWQQQLEQRSEEEQECPPLADGHANGGALQLPPAVLGVVQRHCLEPFIVEVPLHAPATREQWQEWSQQWPLNWRLPESSTLAHLAQPSSEEAAGMQRHMAAAWELAAQSAAAGKVANACVVVDPGRDAVIAQAADCTHKHPLGHAAMLAIAAAAEWQLATWPPDDANAAGGPEEPVGSQQQPQQQHQQQHAGQHKHQHGELEQPGGEEAGDGKRRRHEGCADVRDAATHTAPVVRGQHGHPQEIHTLVRMPQQQQPQQQANSAGAAGPRSAGEADAAADAADACSLADPGPRPYLCSGYDCYVVQEPCAMCAMALVHSRLRRVVYCLGDERYGALGGAYRLHGQRSLNHRYQVFRLPVAEGHDV